MSINTLSYEHQYCFRMCGVIIAFDDGILLIFMELCTPYPAHNKLQ